VKSRPQPRRETRCASAIHHPTTQTGCATISAEQLDDASGHAGRVASRHELSQVAPIHEVHGDPQLAVVLTTVMDTNDVLVPQTRSKIGFT